MDNKKKLFIIAGISAAVGGSLGAVCGSTSLLVVGVVSAVFAVITAWIISGMIK